MKQLVLFSATVALVAAFIPTSALAKGATEVKITGPGLGNGITLAGEGQVGGTQLMQLAEAAGFFPAVFVTSPNPMLSTRPRGALGPRYTITYAMPGPSGVNELRQDLYPYAQPSPLTRMAPGQHFFGTERTVGGWYVASTTLKDDLVAVGLPRTSPANGGGSEIPWTAVGAVAATVVALLVLGVAVLRSRRRPGPDPALRLRLHGSHARTHGRRPGDRRSDRPRHPDL